MAVTLQTSNPQSTFFDSTATSHTFTGVVVAAGTNTAMAVCVEYEDTLTSSGVTYNGVALAKKDNIISGSFGGSDIWFLAAPATGTHDLIVSHSSTARLVVGVYVADGVDQATVLRTAAKSASSGTSVSNTVGSVATGEIVFDSLNLDGTGHLTAPGANQTEQWDIETASGRNTGVSDTQAGVDGGVMSHTWTTATDFCHVATAFIAAAATGVALPNVFVVDTAVARAASW